MLYLRFLLIILSIHSVICPTDKAEKYLDSHTHIRIKVMPPNTHLGPRWTWSTRSWTVSINTTVIYFRIIIMSTRIFLCVFLAFCTNVFPPLPRPHMCHMWGCLSLSVCVCMCLYVCVCKKEERRKVKYKNSIRIRLLLNYHPRQEPPSLASSAYLCVQLPPPTPSTYPLSSTHPHRHTHLRSVFELLATHFFFSNSPFWGFSTVDLKKGE